MIVLGLVVAVLLGVAIHGEIKYRRRRKLATVVYPPRWFPDGDPMAVAA